MEVKQYAVGRGSFFTLILCENPLSAKDNRYFCKNLTQFVDKPIKYV